MKVYGSRFDPFPEYLGHFKTVPGDRVARIQIKRCIEVEDSPINFSDSEKREAKAFVNGRPFGIQLQYGNGFGIERLPCVFAPIRTESGRHR